MELKNKYIEDLIEKFFEGLTSVKEEKELYKYFSMTDVLPPSLEQYRSVLQYMNAEMNEELEQVFEQKNDAMVDTVEQPKSNTLLSKKWILAVSAVAASLLLFFIADPFMNSENFNVYEGSYVRVDGVVSYDKEEIEAERLRIETFVEERLACLNEPFVEAREQVEFLQIDKEVDARLTNLRKPFVDARLQEEEVEKIEELSQLLTFQ